MLQLVKEGKSEIAFVNLPVSDDELFIEPCLEIHDIFVGGKDFNAKKSYKWEDIAKEPLILLEENSNSRRFVNERFMEKNIELKPQIEMAAHELLIRFASIYLGVSCVVEEFSKESLESGKIKKLNLSPPLPARNIGYAYLKHNSLSPAAKAFLNLIKQG